MEVCGWLADSAKTRGSSARDMMMVTLLGRVRLHVKVSFWGRLVRKESFVKSAIIACREACARGPSMFKQSSELTKNMHSTRSGMDFVAERLVVFVTLLHVHASPRFINNTSVFCTSATLFVLAFFLESVALWGARVCCLLAMLLSLPATILYILWSPGRTDENA